MVAARENPKKKSGRRAFVAPDFGARLDYLLKRVNQPSKWLTEVTVSPSGNRPSAAVIANWKKTERVPVEYAVSLHFVFGLEVGVLEIADPADFERRVNDSLAPGSGRYWETLLQRMDTASDALDILFVDAPQMRPRLGNLSFSRPVPKPMRLPQIPLDAALRFTIREEYLVGFASAEGEPPTILLICEDRLGWKTLCPHQHHPGFEHDAGRWSFPAEGRKPLYLDGEFGLHRVVAVAAADALPPAIDEAFRKDNTIWAADALASWLFTSGTEHRVLSRRFNAFATR